RLSREQQFGYRWRGRNRLARSRRLYRLQVNWRLVDGKIHVRHRLGGLQFIVQALTRRPDEQVGCGICFRGLDKYLVLAPLDLERRAPGCHLYDRFADFDDRKVVQRRLQMHDAGAVTGFGFNLLRNSRDKYRRQQCEHQHNASHGLFVPSFSPMLYVRETPSEVSWTVVVSWVQAAARYFS